MRPIFGLLYVASFYLLQAAVDAGKSRWVSTLSHRLKNEKREDRRGAKIWFVVYVYDDGTICSSSSWAIKD